MRWRRRGKICGGRDLRRVRQGGYRGGLRLQAVLRFRSLWGLPRRRRKQPRARNGPLVSKGRVALGRSSFR
ncbi:unnamed protein product [Laminaria digitata]